METKYSLKIYEPDDESCVLVFFESETPFGAMAAGDQSPYKRFKCCCAT